MAVARLSAPPRWLRAVAKHVPDQPRLERELLAASGLKIRGREVRKGGTAEITCEEVRLLAERLPKDERIREALAGVEAAEERERLRTKRIRAMMDKHRR